MGSPTQRSLAEMRKRGYLSAVTERWNAFAKIRQDLYGFVDILCVKQGEIVGVQSTSTSNVSARIAKINAHENYPIVKSSGMRILVQGWSKNSSNRYVLKEVEL